MDTNGKRKHDGEDGGASRGGVKRSKGGNQGKWMTPSHKAKVAALKGRSLEIGDMGFWVTCQRHKEMRAADEIISLCDEYGQKLFGIKTDGATASEEEGDDIEDIDAAIERDLEALKQANKKPGEDAPFELLKVNVDCVLFMRTRAPVDPLLLVREICKGAAATAGDRGRWRARFVNKLTPVSLTGKATEKGLVELARKVLADHFELAEGEGEGEEEEQDKEGNGEEEACSYAIRPTIRAHTTLKRLDVIEKIASMISKKHKVDLKNPDKVIIIEIFQTFCGMSVVGKDWDAMKKYNLYELYTAKSKSGADAEGSKKVVENEEEKPEGGGREQESA